MPLQGVPEGKPKLGFGHKASKVNSKLQIIRTAQILLLGIMCFILGIIASSTKAIVIGLLVIIAGVIFLLWDINRIKELKAREQTTLMHNPPQQLPGRRVPPQQKIIDHKIARGK